MTCQFSGYLTSHQYSRTYHFLKFVFSSSLVGVQRNSSLLEVSFFVFFIFFPGALSKWRILVDRASEHMKQDHAG